MNDDLFDILMCPDLWMLIGVVFGVGAIGGLVGGLASLLIERRWNRRGGDFFED